jgi:hypothetical protein
MSLIPLPDERPAAASLSPWAERIVLALAALLLAVQISPWFYRQGDAAAYISIARHLAHGDGLQNMGSPVLWFPPGYPLLLSPLLCLRYLPLLEISCLHCLLGLGLLWGVYRWARRQAPEGAVWIAAISVGTNAVWIHYRQPISEMAFMTAMAWLLVSVQALARARSPGRFLACLAMVVGLTVAACLIRSLGIALAAGGCCALLAAAVRKSLSRPRAVAAALAIGAAAAITVGGVMLHDLWAAESMGSRTYLNSIEAQRVGTIGGGYWPWCALVVSDIGRVTVPFMFKSYGDVGSWCNVNMLVYAPLFGLLAFGYFRWLRRSGDPLAWSMPFYLAVLTYFRWEAGARYWVPMTSALLMCLWFALEPLRRQNLFRALWVLHILAALTYWIGRDMPFAREMDRQWPTARSLAEQITMSRDRVVIDASLADLGMLLTLQLDRHVKEHAGSLNDPIPISVQWLIIPTERKPPPGFIPRANVGECQLLQRE